MKAFPIRVSELQEWVPHRAPMLWIDEVTSVDASGGECRVDLHSAAHYNGAEGIRPTSMIEWIAQGYGFVRAAQAVTGLIPVAAKPKRAFLVAIRDAQFQYLRGSVDLSELESLRVQVKLERELGPLSLVQGSVLKYADEVLATVNLKLFAAD